MDTKKLRQKILDLAIRGKLVPQDPNDEPASVLLERIRAEKEQLIKEGKIKRTKKSNASDTSHYENMPFTIPNGWVWCRLEDIAYVAAGSTPNKESFVENGVPYIKMYNLRNQKIDFEFHPQYITEEVHNNKLARSRTQPGDLLMNIVGPPLGKLAIIPESLPEANFNQAAVLIRPFKFKPALTQYLFYYLSELSEISSISTKGSAGQVNISLTQSQQMRIALPPLAELERMTQKIETLFSKIDVLETSTGNIFDLISKIKSSILEIALSGKLVSQDKTDEPAIMLLKSINPYFNPTDNRHYENLPSGWVECVLNDIVEIQNGYAFKSSLYSNDGVRIIRITNVQDGYIVDDSPKYYPLSQMNGLEDYILKENDLLMSLTGNVGRVAMMPANLLPAALNQRVCCITPKSSEICKQFIFYLLRTDTFITSCIESGKGVAQLNVSTEWLKSYRIVLPPKEEQIRIVLAVQNIMTKIDEILADL